MPIKDRIAVYQGMPMDCVNLQLTLAGNGIDVEVEPGSMAGRAGDGAFTSLVFVSQSDVERASPLVEAFRQSGQQNH